ncbi:MAG: ATP-binding protein [Saprospiraceae bacterium]
MQNFIGRKKERKILQEALDSASAEMVAVIGRRRVGKTLLINHTYQDHIVFKIAGSPNAPLEEQLRIFTEQLNIIGEQQFEQPKDWLDAFFNLRTAIAPLIKTEKKVIFFDEIPWLASSNTGFLRGLDFFWNNWANTQKIVIALCGSAASWMIQNVVNNTGGLHNRITRYIHLSPFTLGETEEFIQSLHLRFNRYQITQIYMAMGGIPHYLKELRKGRSAIQNIDDTCFSQTGLLRYEFNNLYRALFQSADYHIEIIRALAKKQKGLTRDEILKQAKVAAGGTVSRVLTELEESGFIHSYHPFGKKKKGMLYRLTDEYSLFYLNFIDDKTNIGEGTWQYFSQTSQYKAWSGYAFESICLKHVEQIRKAIGIAGVYTQNASFIKKGTKTEAGTQIDLLIDRNDQVINLVEVKFYNKEFTLTKAYANRIQQKIWVFEEETKTKKLISPVLVTTYGLKENEYSLNLIEHTVILDDLFQ